MGGRSTWSWYSVKTLYRTEVIGKPGAIDSYYDAQATLVEERIVLFKARSFDEAIKKAEKEALIYVDEPEYENSYGQKVRTKYLGCCKAFDLYDFNVPTSGVELYSETEVVSENVKDSIIVDRRMGKTEDAKRTRSRKKFIRRDLAEEFYGSILE